MGVLQTQTPAIDKTVKIFEFLSTNNGATFSQIYQGVGLPKSSTSSLLASLVAHGLLRQEKNHYYLGLRLYEFGSKAEESFDIKKLAAEPLTQLRDTTQLTCHLGVQDGGSAIYLLKLESPGAIVVRSWVGKKLSLYSSGLGKALLAWLPESAIDLYLPDENFETFTPTTIKTKTELKNELALIRQRGWAYDNAEDSEGVYCISAPIFDKNGNVIAAISASGVAFQMTPELIPQNAQRIVDTAKTISDKVNR
ncbi:IclR family transcriptional regulator [Brenneria goodwinii]|uniref:IclR family transcriptional regulator n=1 Tax=Brenneria goodwinii TaxID=1109412 RepID=UPI0036F1DCB0